MSDAAEVQYEEERRWLLARMPDLNDSSIFVCKNEFITQFYTPTEPGSGTQRFRRSRVHNREDQYWVTFKGPKVNGVGLEEEPKVSRWVYEMMQHSSVGEIEKLRATILSEGHYYELDQFSGRHTGLIIVELEFRPPKDEGLSEDDIADLHDQFLALVLPAYFGENTEITEDKRYSNYRLATEGLPK